MIDWVKSAQRVAAIVPPSSRPWSPGGTRLSHLVFFPEAPIHARTAALEQFTRNTRLPVPMRTWSSANPVGMLWPEMDVASLG